MAEVGLNLPGGGERLLRLDEFEAERVVAQMAQALFFGASVIARARRVTRWFKKERP